VNDAQSGELTENILVLILLYMYAFQDIHRLHSLELLVVGCIVCSLPTDAALGVSDSMNPPFITGDDLTENSG
jgi:hypothetical protein